MQTESASGASGTGPLPAVLRERLAGLRASLGTDKATSVALGCSASTYTRAAGGLALRPGSVALIKTGLDKIDGATGAEEQTK